MPNTQLSAATHSPDPLPSHDHTGAAEAHSITADEYKRIEAALGRTPSLTELGIFSVMWSEHCSL